MSGRSFQAIRMVESSRAFLDHISSMVATARSALDAGDRSTAWLWVEAAEEELDWVIDELVPRSNNPAWRAQFDDHLINAFLHLVDGLAPLAADIERSPD
ncbi:MAG: hypothetical protein RLZZ362_1917 [Actinomycetota bacterium]|jgi:hypothetical protein